MWCKQAHKTIKDRMRKITSHKNTKGQVCKITPLSWDKNVNGTLEDSGDNWKNQENPRKF